ncbi:Hypothetical protein A7982_01102 [Minicystis rosea]|nr:Hypothetical protein A7982_01102 [Minicystis rosea]
MRRAIHRRLCQERRLRGLALSRPEPPGLECAAEVVQASELGVGRCVDRHDHGRSIDPHLDPVDRLLPAEPLTPPSSEQPLEHAQHPASSCRALTTVSPASGWARKMELPNSRPEEDSTRRGRSRERRLRTSAHGRCRAALPPNCAMRPAVHALHSVPTSGPCRARSTVRCWSSQAESDRVLSDSSGSRLREPKAMFDLDATKYVASEEGFPIDAEDESSIEVRLMSDCVLVFANTVDYDRPDTMLFFRGAGDWHSHGRLWEATDESSVPSAILRGLRRGGVLIVREMSRDGSHRDRLIKSDVTARRPPS